MSDTEIIPEIEPRKRGPKRRKKIEIIPEIPEKKSSEIQRDGKIQKRKKTNNQPWKYGQMTKIVTWRKKNA